MDGASDTATHSKEMDEEHHEQVTPIDIVATGFTGADAPKQPVIIPRPPGDERLMNSLMKFKRNAVDTKKELCKEKHLAVRKRVWDKLCNLLCCCVPSSEVDVV
ncbi:TPA: hypothetical protein ACH3X1_009565 [Trebouxia sp. C0004]